MTKKANLRAFPAPARIKNSIRTRKAIDRLPRQRSNTVLARFSRDSGHPAGDKPSAGIRYRQPIPSGQPFRPQKRKEPPEGGSFLSILVPGYSAGVVVVVTASGPSISASG